MLSWCSSSLFWNMCHHCMPLLCLSELNWLLLMFCSNSVLLWVARSAGFRHQVQFDKEEKAQREEETQGKEGGRGSRGEWNVGYVGNMWEVCGALSFWKRRTTDEQHEQALHFLLKSTNQFRLVAALHIVNLCGAMARQTRHPAPWHAAL